MMIRKSSKLKRWLVQLITCGALLGLSSHAHARTKHQDTQRAPSDDSVDILDAAAPKVDAPRKSADEDANDFLASGDPEGDLKHYQNLSRHLGVDIGMMIPFGDFEGEFSMSPLIGMHLSWEAIPPFGFVVSFMRSSAGDKNLASIAKLSVTSISMGAVIAPHAERVQPFFKIEGAFLFNDLNFNNGRTIISGNDILLTTVGLNVGLGIDFVVGREVSLGLDLTYHYAVPKMLNLNDGSTFNLGSPFATAGLRVNF